MKVAIVHDWLTGMRGGEKCLEVFCELFPTADIFTLLYKPGSVSSIIESHKIHTSSLQSIPGIHKHYRKCLALFPFAIEEFDLSAYDLVLSSSHCVAHGVKTSAEQLHLCYCYTPMRYIHDMIDVYFPEERIGQFKRGLVDIIAGNLVAWDLNAANSPDYYIAISDYIHERIERLYHRDSHVIYPPVDCQQFSLAAEVEDFYLMVGAFAPYKRVDLAIDAFTKMNKPLIIIGSGQDYTRCKEQSEQNIDFLGWQDDSSINYYYSRCKALIFPGEEDFGITPLESQASGRPVIAYGQGGALETIIGLDNDQGKAPTGLFFKKQSVDSLIAAVEQFESNENSFTAKACRANAERFDRTIFKAKIQRYINIAIARFKQT